MYACPPGDERMLRANVQTPFMVVVTFVTASSVNASWRELPVQNAAVIQYVNAESWRRPSALTLNW